MHSISSCLTDRKTKKLPKPITQDSKENCCFYHFLIPFATYYQGRRMTLYDTTVTLAVTQLLGFEKSLKDPVSHGRFQVIKECEIQIKVTPEVTL